MAEAEVVLNPEMWDQIMKMEGFRSRVTRDNVPEEVVVTTSPSVCGVRSVARRRRCPDWPNSPGPGRQSQLLPPCGWWSPPAQTLPCPAQLWVNRDTILTAHAYFCLLSVPLLPSCPFTYLVLSKHWTFLKLFGSTRGGTGRPIIAGPDEVWSISTYLLVYNFSPPAPA